MVQRTSLLQAHFWYAHILTKSPLPEKIYFFSTIFQEETTGLPELISGAATWSHFYNEKDKLSTDVPLRTIRLALR
jgi:hypothetical protein